MLITNDYDMIWKARYLANQVEQRKRNGKTADILITNKPRTRIFCYTHVTCIIIDVISPFEEILQSLVKQLSGILSKICQLYYAFPLHSYSRS